MHATKWMKTQKWPQGLSLGLGSAAYVTPQSVVNPDRASSRPVAKPFLPGIASQLWSAHNQAGQPPPACIFGVLSGHQGRVLLIRPRRLQRALGGSFKAAPGPEPWAGFSNK